jgi:hypothetical protein
MLSVTVIIAAEFPERARDLKSMQQPLFSFFPA